ncbi:MAG: ribonuclease H family protein [Bacteroidales bacterium]|jgi:ribonuclease HI|nr:ribonuclease H family protein [Bacteroidales bacterium]MDD2687255.1 ribonuclease H family protein [Bacteroidales bacterium]MDD3330417.1 ribonuclease H family protein [Bacteroidales bacterium]MDD3691457.1 ribonuclease H family protein [Bacteroidales bacterium]MDD4044840.1 ribonuclease H family protein [Bacteroidales bacterium]
MAKKYYVVWNGRETGIYDNWEACKRQVEGFTSPLYKAFLKLEDAEEAFRKGSEAYLKPKEHPMQMIFDALYGSPIIPSISVDGACNGKTKQAEYQGVDTKSKQRIFHKGPFPEGTNNIMEFLALVHALSYCKRHHLDVPIYSDSVTAIKWVKTKKARSKMSLNPQNAPLFALIERAEKWLKNNTYTNQILKWETQTWGEIPADFGRK